MTLDVKSNSTVLEFYQTILPLITIVIYYTNKQYGNTLEYKNKKYTKVQY